MPPLYSHLTGLNLDLLSLVEACATCAPGELQITMVAECLRQLEIQHFGMTAHLHEITGDVTDHLKAKIAELDTTLAHFRKIHSSLKQNQGGPHAQPDSTAQNPPSGQERG